MYKVITSMYTMALVWYVYDVQDATLAKEIKL